MARIRSVKPEFWTDRKLARCASRDARLLYIALWNIADEHSRLNGDPVWIKGQVFPYEDDIDANAVSKMLAELESPTLGAVVSYEADGDPYLFLPKLARHQRLETAKVDSRLPAPPDEKPAAPIPPQHHEMPGADLPAPRADSLAPDADSPEKDANESPLLYGAGGMLQVAGSRGAAREVVRDPQRQQPDANGLHEIPDDFAITDGMRRTAHRTYPGLDLDWETEQFCRHWRSEGRRKKSWPDAWLKWIADSHKRAAERARSGGGSSGGSPPRESTGTVRARAAMEAGERVQAMMDGRNGS